MNLSSLAWLEGQTGKFYFKCINSFGRKVPQMNIAETVVKVTAVFRSDILSYSQVAKRFERFSYRMGRIRLMKARKICFALVTADFWSSV